MICEKLNPQRDNNSGNNSTNFAAYNGLYIIAMHFHYELQIY